MVYCGKPSKGCGLCRSRRIKCDGLHPSCTQCKRVASPCPGYRNETDLVFRDLSEDVRLKCMKGKSKQEKQSSAPSKIPKRVKDKVIDKQWLEQPYKVSNDPAALFFFNDYVLLETGKRSNMFDMLPSMYESSRAGSPLADIISALGLVCLSNTMSAPEMMISARARYVSALHNINATIRDPEGAMTDDTLMVVILLGLYEDNTAIPGSLEQWSKHVRGALALLEIRGMDQLKSCIGRQLITNLRTSTIANCLLKYTSVPECIMRWSDLLREQQSPEEASATALAGLFASFCSLQERIKTSEESESSESILSIAFDVDGDLEKWAANECFERPYSVKAEPTCVLAFEGVCHTYHNLSVATHWNHYRSVRIMLHEIILGQLELRKRCNEIDSYFQSTAPYETSIELSKSLIVTLSQDVCTSLRYCLGLSDMVNTAHQPEKAANAKLLLWPLYTAGKSPCVPYHTSLWVADTFDFITRVSGVQRGAGLAKALRAWPCGPNPRSPNTHWRETVLRTNDTKRATEF